MARITTLLVAIAVLSTGATGCGSDDEDAAPSDDREVFLVYERSGGFAGLEEELRCQRDGRCALSERTGPQGRSQLEAFVSEADLERLRDAFERADFESLDASYPSPEGTADAFSYEILFEGTLVEAGDGGEIPDGLQDLIEELNSLVSQVRRGDFRGGEAGIGQAAE